MVLPRSLRVSIAAGVLAVAAGRSTSIDSSPRADVTRLLAVRAATTVPAMPAALVPAVIDTLQRSGGASYAPTPAAGAAPMVARNAEHGLAARFGDQRVDVASDGDTAFTHALTLSARDIAIDGTTLALHGERASVPADGRVVYAHAPADGVQFDEWFRNGPLGLQHGFDIAALPAEARDLQVTVDVGDGWVTSSAFGDANGAVDVHRADGQGERYAYSFLRAWDASGRFLPSTLMAVDRGLRIAVDVRDAALPITIDPLLQQAILTPGDATPGFGFGASVAVRGNRALVGAPYTTVGSNAQQGVVYMFQRNTTTGIWSLRSTISDAAGLANDWFGYSVAMGALLRGRDRRRRWRIPPASPMVAKSIDFHQRLGQHQPGRTGLSARH